MRPDLTHLLDPVTTAQFFEEHWEQAPLVVRRCTPDWFAELFSLDDFERVLLSPVSSQPTTGLQGSIGVSTTIDGKHVEIPLNVDGHGFVSLSAAYRALDSGHTLCLRHLRRVSEPLATLCARVEDDLQQPMGCNVFVTPANIHGYSPHFDTADTFFLQIAGAKRWRIHRPTFDLACGSDYEHADPTQLGEPYMDVVLEPGDTLYLPRGWIHAGAAGPEASVHITLGVVPLTWVQLAHQVIDLAAKRDRRLRQSLPLHRTDLPSIGEQVLDLLGDLPAVGLDAVEQLLAGRVADLPTQLVGGRVRQVLDPPRLTDRSRLCRRPGLAPVVRVARDQVSLHFLGSSVSGPAPTEPALRFVAATPAFRVGDLPAPLDAEDRFDLARRLLVEGYCDLVEPDGAERSSGLDSDACFREPSPRSESLGADRSTPRSDR